MAHHRKRDHALGDVPPHRPDGPNPLELFQIWLNLPPQSKMVPAYFGMLWDEEIPTITPAPGVSVDVMAGSIGDSTAPSPPPDSWASREDSHLAIWLIRLEPGAQLGHASRPAGVNRMLHCFQGDDVQIGSTRFEAKIGVRLDPTSADRDRQPRRPAEFLLLQGQPIGAPVFQMGPVRDELGRGVAHGGRGLPPHPVRWLALVDAEPGPRSIRGPVRPPRRRPGRTTRHAAGALAAETAGDEVHGLLDR